VISVKITDEAAEFIKKKSGSDAALNISVVQIKSG
jgi:hypothetical protein